MATVEAKVGAAGQVDSLPSPLEAINDMRSVARWTIGAAAAVGAAAIGGTPLAAIGKVRNTGDVVAVAAGLVLVLAGVCWAIWQTSEALTPMVTTIEMIDTPALRPLRELIARSPRAFFGPFGTSVEDLRSAYRRETDIARQITDKLAAERSPARRATWQQALRDTEANIDYCARVHRRLLAFAHAWQVRAVLRRARLHTLAATVVSTGGVVLLLTATASAK